MAQAGRRFRTRRGPFAVLAILALLATSIQALPANASPNGTSAQSAATATTVPAAVPTLAKTAASCTEVQSGAARPRLSSGRDAVRTTIGVAKTMGVPIKGQIIAVMVMYQETSLRNLANDGTSTHQSWPSPGGAYWLGVTKLSLKYPHDKFGSREGAHDTDSIGLYQQRPAYAWGNYGNSTGTSDPEGVVQRLLDPRWSAMAFFGGPRTAAPKGGLLDVAGWQTMVPTVAADTVQQSNHPDYYAQWEGPATAYVNSNQDAPAINLPWVPGGGRGALSCTSIPVDPASGEPGHDPDGQLDVVSVQGKTFRVAGWALDPDAINGVVEIHVYDYGPLGTSRNTGFLANKPRADVERALNVVGKFGFDLTVPYSVGGQHTICAYAINIGRGVSNPLLGCRNAFVPSDPVGFVDSVTVSNQTAVVSGWALDRTSPSLSTQVHVYVNYQLQTGIADRTRSDVNSALGVTGKHGYAIPVSLRGGSNLICIYAIGIDPNTHSDLGCRSVTAPYPPSGNLDAVTVAGSVVTITGWTYDPNSPATSTSVYFYVNDRFYSGRSDRPRSDVNAVMGIAGRHGFSESAPLRSGRNVVCVYSIGVDVTTHTLLGCPTVQGPAAGPPIGYVDSMTVSGSIVTVRGWALDPTDSGTSTPVHLYLNGRGPGVVTANLPRADVGAALKVAGQHGFSAKLGLDPGANTICVYAIGINPNVHTGLSCQLVYAGAARSAAGTLAAPDQAGITPEPQARAPLTTAAVTKSPTFPTVPTVQTSAPATASMTGGAETTAVATTTATATPEAATPTKPTATTPDAPPSPSP